MKKRREKVALSGSKLAAYAAAGVASAVAASNEAEAGIIYSGPLNLVVNDTTLGGGSVGFNLPFGVANSFNFTLAHGVGTTNLATGFAFGGGDLLATPGASFAGFTASAFNYMSNIGAGAPISTLANWQPGSNSGTMAFNGGYGNDQFLGTGIGFLGIRFNGNQYGWIRVNMNGAPLNSFTIVDYAFTDTPGESLFAGQISAVPEPSSLAALAIGAAAVVGWRRLRRKPEGSESAA